MDVYIHKTDAMRKIIQLVSRGYTRYTIGESSPKKIQSLIYKFEDRYGINRTTQQRYRAKAKGEANAQLILWLSSDEVISWWLLVTAGEGIVQDLEQLQDTAQRTQRIELTGYAVLKRPRTNQAAAWTWRMTEDNYKAWQERLRTAVIAKNDELIRQAMFSLKRTPAFSGSRKQAFALFRQAKSHWRKINGSEWPYEDIYIGWFGKFQKAEILDSSDLTGKPVKTVKQEKSIVC